MRRNNKILLSGNPYKKVFIVFLFLFNIFSSIKSIIFEHKLDLAAREYIDSAVEKVVKGIEGIGVKAEIKINSDELQKILKENLKIEHFFSVSQESKDFLNNLNKNINFNIEISKETKSSIINFSNLFNSKIENFIKSFIYGAVFLKSIFLLIDNLCQKKNILNGKENKDAKDKIGNLNFIKKYLKLKYIFLSIVAVYSGYRFFNIDFSIEN